MFMVCFGDPISECAAGQVEYYRATSAKRDDTCGRYDRGRQILDNLFHEQNRFCRWTHVRSML